MSDTDDLEQRRQEIIERIKQVFPKNPPSKGKKNFKVTRGRAIFEEQKLIENFEGKSWEEMVSHPSLVYEMSDIDFTRAMSDKAYLYYFPAFLVATLNEPYVWIYSGGISEKINKPTEQFSLEQLDVLIDYFEYHIRFWARQKRKDTVIKDLEDRLLYFMLQRDELVAGKK